MTLWNYFCILALIPRVMPTSTIGPDCPSFVKVSLTPSFGAYEFNEDSDRMLCSFVDPVGATEQNGPWKLVLKNSDLGIVIVSQDIQSRAANITFQVQNIQSSTTFSCELVNSNGSQCEHHARVSVFVHSPVNCTTDKDCWGYGRNLVCDAKHTRRCMCAPKTARTSESPLCIELATTDTCKQLDCDGSEAGCVCISNQARVLTRSEYSFVHLANDSVNNDIIEIDGNRWQQKNLLWQRDECIRCLRASSELQSLQIGLFLVGLILAFTAVTLMAIVLRKMWMYYRLPPELLEASRDLERETIEREAELMAQRDKPPSYAEVLEYDLRISGYPPPAYEELATVVRGLSDRRRRQAAEFSAGHQNDSNLAVVEPRSSRHFILNPWHRIAQSYMNTSPVRTLALRETSNDSDVSLSNQNSPGQRY